MSQDLQKYVRSPTPNSDLRTFVNSELAKIQQATDTFFKMLGDLNMLAGSQEGDFLLSIKGSTAAGAGTYTTRYGRYLKLGRLVIFAARVDWSAHTGTGDMVVTGLPFTLSASIRSQIQLLSLNGGTVPATDVALTQTNNVDITIATANFAATRAMGSPGALILTGSYFTD